MSEDSEAPMTEAELDDVSGGLYRYTPRCRTCGAVFASEADLSSHELNIHRSPVPEPQGSSVAVQI